MKTRRILILMPVIGLLCLLLAAALIQFVPFGRDHSNPPVIVEPAWDSPETRALAQRACFDCHSNETVWPAYSNFAPVSWLVTRDVNQGRKKLNFSEWNRRFKDADESAEVVQEGEMPLGIYLIMHPEAKLTEAEKQALAAGLQRTLGGNDR